MGQFNEDACLRALRTWPRNGPPRDAAAWLITVGRNAGVDGTRQRHLGRRRGAQELTYPGRSRRHRRQWA